MRKRKGRKGLEVRLQITLSPEELKAVDDFRFQNRMPSRAAAIRDLFRRGLGAVVAVPKNTGIKSAD
jgi:metal-responsive CopG/Arc/MetJ family transcriptional regulator